MDTDTALKKRGKKWGGGGGKFSAILEYLAAHQDLNILKLWLSRGRYIYSKHIAMQIRYGSLEISASSFKLLMDFYFAFQGWQCLLQVCSSCLQPASNSSYTPASHPYFISGDTL